MWIAFKRRLESLAVDSQFDRTEKDDDEDGARHFCSARLLQLGLPGLRRDVDGIQTVPN